MKLQVTQENLSKALNNVAKVATTRNTLPILSNVLIKTTDNRVCVAATDLNIAITQYIGSKVSSTGAITVPARLAQDFISSLPSGVIELDLDGTKLHVKTDKHESTINGTVADDFPVMPNITKGTKWGVPSKALKEALSQVVIAASTDDSRPVLTAVNFHTRAGNLYAVATDSYRLAEKKIQPMKTELNINVPASAIQDLLRVIEDNEEEVKIINDDQQILFKKGEIELVARLIDGSYPDYKKLIPEKFINQATLEKSNLSNIVKVSSLFARESSGSVVLEVNEDSSTVSVKSVASQLGENNASAEANNVSGSADITLNSRYIIDAIGAIESKSLTIGFNGKLDPLLLYPDGDESYRHVIMPLKS